MPVKPFNAGAFTTYPDVVEWDGTNHEDLIEWVQGRDAPSTPPDQQWVIESVTADLLVLHGHGNATGRAYVKRGHWLFANQWFSDDGSVGGVFVGGVDPAGKWRSDEYGRPTNLDVLLSDGDGPDPDVPLSPPIYAGASITNTSGGQTATISWQPPEVGTAVEYEVHELRKVPDSTLKATVTTLSRTSGKLQPFELEYAIRAVNADGYVSRFSATVLVTIATDPAHSTIAPGRPVGWDA